MVDGRELQVQEQGFWPGGLLEHLALAFTFWGIRFPTWKQRDKRVNEFSLLSFITSSCLLRRMSLRNQGISPHSPKHSYLLGNARVKEEAGGRTVVS